MHDARGFGTREHAFDVSAVSQNARCGIAQFMSDGLVVMSNKTICSLALEHMKHRNKLR